jgi:hypothetical protein
MTEQARLSMMAHYVARKTVMDHLRNAGIRWLDLEPAEIRKATDALLEIRRAEFIRQAQAILARR